MDVQFTKFKEAQGLDADASGCPVNNSYVQ
jgi:hypothetical protein